MLKMLLTNHGNNLCYSNSPEGKEAAVPDKEGWPDEELFVRKAFEQNPEEACGLLFKRYHPILCNHAVRLTYSRQVAEDLVAEVFYQFWKNKVYQHVTTSYRAYLFKSVRNRAYNYLKAELKNKVPAENYSLESTLRQPDQYLFFTELSRRVETLVEALPPQSKKVFILHRFEGKKYQEIAEEMQLSVRTVEVHLRRAIAALRKGLEQGGFLAWLLVWLGGQ